MNTIFVASLILTSASSVLMKPYVHPLSDEFIDEINEAQSSWTARKNFDINTPMEYLTKLSGLREDLPQAPLPSKSFHLSELRDIPDSFDARQEWKKCKSLSHIRDQAACGSCWAVAGAAAMTDRLCIKSDGNITISVSASDIMSCVGGYGCNGGTASAPWYYWMTNGIVSGGDYGSNGCKNYPFPSCRRFYWSRKPSCGPQRATPACRRVCESNSLIYNDDKTYGASAYALYGEEEMQREIMDNGPIEGAMRVYDDFFQYSYGVYHYVRGDFKFGHAIKILGWGEENGEKYWLCANSWNEEWGDHGFFKIRRGTNECDIERYAYAGLPKLSH